MNNKGETRSKEIEIPAVIIIAVVVLLGVSVVSLADKYLQSKCIDAHGSWDTDKGCQIK